MLRPIFSADINHWPQTVLRLKIFSGLALQKIQIFYKPRRRLRFPMQISRFLFVYLRFWKMFPKPVFI